MSTPRHLNNAPITEAILDVRVKASRGFDPADFSSLRSELQAEFPKVQERKAARFQFQVPSTQPPAVEELGLQGFFFKSDDEKLIAQFRTDGFTLNRLKPYTSWIDIFSRAQQLWQLYVNTARPEAAVRLALRYINHIQLPSELDGLGIYMRVPPKIPRELPREISAFFYKVTINDIQRQLSAHIVQSVEVLNGRTLLLDIDAFYNVDPDWAPSDPRVFEVLGRLHDFKNEIFFNLLTEEALRRFE